MSHKKNILKYDEIENAPWAHRYLAAIAGQIGIHPKVTLETVCSATGLTPQEVEQICQHPPIKQHIELSRDVALNAIGRIQECSFNILRMSTEAIEDRLNADKDNTDPEAERLKVRDILKILEAFADRMQASPLQKISRTQVNVQKSVLVQNNRTLELTARANMARVILGETAPLGLPEPEAESVEEPEEEMAAV